MNIFESFIRRASEKKQRIVLPEGAEERTLQAADKLLKDEVCHIILLGCPEEIESQAQKMGLGHIDKAEIVNPKTHERKQAYTELLLELRKHKGMTPEKAAALVEDPLYLGALMLKAGDADGEVAGAKNYTGDVLRPALQIIKTSKGVSTVSGLFIMLTQTPEFGEDGMLLCADCAVTPAPTAEQLAQIAVSSAKTAKSLTALEPRVAMLSFSTKGSGQHEKVDLVVEATRLAQEMAPEFNIDGELQADAALVPEVAALKAPDSPVAGKANVLVFPSLETGNIGYKLVQRLGRAKAIGPVLQGMAAPVNDLSRGCSVDDIYYLVAITALQAIGLKEDEGK